MKNEESHHKTVNHRYALQTQMMIIIHMQLKAYLYDKSSVTSKK